MIKNHMESWATLQLFKKEFRLTYLLNNYNYE
jgi:hypothetical protein